MDELLHRPLQLWLRCTACGYTRQHEVAKVLYDLGTADRRKRGEETPYDEVAIPQRITCPKCGAVDQYELTSEARLAIMAQVLLGVARAEETGEAPFSEAPPGEGNLVISRFTLTDGREMHPFEARDMYREQVAAEPDNPELRVRYANVLHSLSYDDEASEQYRGVLALDPTYIEAETNLGMLANKAGHRKEARGHFRRVIELAPQSRLPREELEDYLLYAQEQLGMVPPSLAAAGVETAAARQSRPNRPVATPPWGRKAVGSTVRAQKVGRNEPCPCGSGKKYKKCCGR